ncbi:MAG: trypsin-like serine protease [Myxococcales bacterium]|nr:trypsin-like serine protease [Myxococcales bacterium]
MSLLLPALVAACAAPAEVDAWFTRTDAIVRGWQASNAELYATVALVEPGDGAMFCTGALVSPDVVLTAAHCLAWPGAPEGVTPDEVEIALGALDAEAPAERRPVRAIALHPAHGAPIASDDPAGVGRADDLAVLVLAAPVDVQAPAPLLSEAELASMGEGASLLIAGYGLVDARAFDAGRLYVGQTAWLRRSPFELLAGGAELADVCMGDSGGPAYAFFDGVPRLVGVTSRGADDSAVLCGDRGIYTLAPAYRAWIEGVIAEAGARPLVEAPPAQADGLAVELEVWPEPPTQDPDLLDGPDGCTFTADRRLGGPDALLLAVLLLAGVRQRRSRTQRKPRRDERSDHEKA